MDVLDRINRKVIAASQRSPLRPNTVYLSYDRLQDLRNSQFTLEPINGPIMVLGLRVVVVDGEVDYVQASYVEEHN